MTSALLFRPVGAIFDIDDTLLDNYPKTHVHGLHEHARLLAIREAGRKHGIAPLAEVPAELNAAAFKRAVEHSIEGASGRFFTKSALYRLNR